MELTEKQKQAIASPARYKYLNWGRRSGKTTEFAYEALGTAMSVPGARIKYYAQTISDARDIAWGLFLSVFGESIVKKNETLLEFEAVNLLGGTSKISLRGWESVVIDSKGRGNENDLLLMDEVAFCRNFIEMWDTVLDPTLLTSKGRAVFASTPNGFNHWYDMIDRAGKLEDTFFSQATSYDNPANDPAEVDKKRSELGEDKFAQEYLADFRKMEGLVYKEFDRSLHTYSGDANVVAVKKMGAVDPGFNNPCAVLHIFIDKDGVIWVDDEWYQRGQVHTQISAYVKAQGFQEVVSDPEDASLIETMNRDTIHTVAVKKGKGSVADGVNKVQSYFRQNKIKINKRCVNLIRELETYSYALKRHNQNEPEEPIKENDHAVDALRYAVMRIDGHPKFVMKASELAKGYYSEIGL